MTNNLTHNLHTLSNQDSFCWDENPASPGVLATLQHLDDFRAILCGLNSKGTVPYPLCPSILHLVEITKPQY